MNPVLSLHLCVVIRALAQVVMPEFQGLRPLSHLPSPHFFIIDFASLHVNFLWVLCLLRTLIHIFNSSVNTLIPS